jgi:hypothetical protein
MGVSPPHRDHQVVNSDQWPANPEAAAALVALVVTDIRALDDEARDTLLSDFLLAAWPSSRGQRQ